MAYKIPYPTMNWEADDARASDSICLMVTMLVPRTEKIPLFTDFFGKNTPYFSQNEDFCCKKNHPFFLFQGEHITCWPLLK